MISMFDYVNDKVIAQYLMMSNEQTNGYKAQGLRFVDKRHVLAGLTTQVVNGYKETDNCKKMDRGFIVNKKTHAENRVILMRLDFSVDDIASGKAEPVSSASFSIIGVLHVGVGSFDGLDYRDGVAMVADQLNDKTLFFKVDPAADEPLKLAFQRHGYIMPHGVAFSRHRRDHMAVTSYGMNSVIVQPVPASSK